MLDMMEAQKKLVKLKTSLLKYWQSKIVLIKKNKKNKKTKKTVRERESMVCRRKDDKDVKLVGEMYQNTKIIQ